MRITVAAGTTSKLKIRAVEEALKRLGIDAEVLPTEVESVVPAQPFDIGQMLQGATHRGHAARMKRDAVYGVGIESGLVNLGGFWFDAPCVFVVTLTPKPQTAFAYGAFFPIPEGMVRKVKELNTELGVVIQALAGGGEKDAQKWLSDGKVPRDEILVQALLCAFTPLLHADLYPS